jgi:hypothetical protein
VDLGVVVAALGLLLLLSPLAERNTDVAVGILAADHETNLARGIGGDGGIGVFGNREDLLAVLLELGNERQVKPLVLGCATKRNKSAKYESFAVSGRVKSAKMSTHKMCCNLSTTAGFAYCHATRDYRKRSFARESSHWLSESL